MKQLSKSKWARRGLVFLMALVLVVTMAPAALAGEPGEPGDHGEQADVVLAQADPEETAGPEGIYALAEDPVKVYIDFEGYNLGQGFYIEPTVLELPAGSTASDATEALLDEKGYTYDAEAPWGGWYLDRVYGMDKGDATFPGYITETLGPGSGDGSLGSGDYVATGGWMNTVNHAMPDVGADEYVLNEGDVIRWQFSVQGWGEDFGVETWAGPSSLYTHSDKTELIRALFAEGVNEYAIPAALDVIIDPLATEGDVAAAKAALLPAETTTDTIVFDVTPAGAVIAVYNSAGTRFFPGSDGVFSDLTEDAVYTYTVALKGYKTEKGDFTYSESQTITVSLDPVTSTPLPDISSSGDWLNARGNVNNMGVVGAKTPRSAVEGELKWAKQFGSGGLFSTTPNTPIILGDTLIVSAGSTIFKIDRETGETIDQNTMVAAPSYGITSNTYGGGMVFVPISNGRIQAFNASTLESLWVSEQIGGQSLSPIYYHDGYVYTGYWSSETADNYYVCLSITDEDPGNATETKRVQWKHKSAGGFYWAGGIVKGDYIVFGSDNGVGTIEKEGPSKLFSLNRVTGEVVDVLEGLVGDQRSGISYDAATDRLYFSTKAGYVNSVKIGSDGKFIGGSLLKRQLTANYEATGTPVVYEGVVFVGTGGGVGAPGKLCAVDAATFEIIDSADLVGYPQGSPLLSTAYEEGGKLYLYITYNQLPGGLAVAEYDISAKTLTASELFAPPAGMQNYCIDSVVCDAEGTLYYHNDTTYLFAVKLNSAYLPDLRAEPGVFKQEFKPTTITYDLVVPAETESVEFSFTIPDGMTVKVNDEPADAYDGAGTAVVALDENSAGTAVIEVKSGEHSRTYTVKINAPDTGLTVAVNQTNTAPSSGAVYVGFGPDNTYAYTYTGAPSDSNFQRVWLKPDDSYATWTAVVVSGVGGGGTGYGGNTLDLPARDEGSGLNITQGTSGNPNRLTINWAAGHAEMTVKVTVTAADKMATEDYFVVLTSLSRAKTAKVAEISMITAGRIEGEYTAESWEAMQTAITGAIAAVNAATTIAEIDAVQVPSLDLLEKRPIDYVIDYAAETFTVGEGFQYAIVTSVAPPAAANSWSSSRAPVNLKARLDSSVAAKPVISYLHIRSVATPSLRTYIPLIRYGGYTAAQLKAAAFLNTVDGRFELDPGVYGNGDHTVHHSAASNMSSPIIAAAHVGVGRHVIDVVFASKAAKRYAQILPVDDFKSAITTLDVPASNAVNNWNSSLKIGSFISFNGAPVDAATDPTGSSVVRWMVPDTFYSYEYTTVKNSVTPSDYMPVAAGAQVDPALYNGSKKVTVYVRKAAGDKSSASKQSGAFTLPKMAGAPKPKFNGVSMAVTGVSAAMEYRVELAGETTQHLQTWTRATGKTIPVKEEWEGATLYVRTAATASKIYSATSAAVALQARTDINFGTGDGAIDPASVLKYTVSNGRLTLQPKKTLSKEFTNLKYTASSKVEISMNGEYWVAAATAKDLRPYLSLVADQEGLKGTLYVRILGGGSGSKAVNTSRGELITINIGNGEIVAGGPVG